MKTTPQGIKLQFYHQYGPLGSMLKFPHFLIALFINVILSFSHIGGSSQHAILAPEPTLISSFQLLSHVWLFATPWHTRPPCPSSTPGVYSNSCPLSWWFYPTISSYVIPLTSCLQSFPASGSFQMSQLFASGSQRIGVSASTSVLQMNIQDWSPLGWTGWSPCSPRDSQESSPTPQFKSINSSVLSFVYSPTFTSLHDYWKNHNLD